MGTAFISIEFFGQKQFMRQFERRDLEKLTDMRGGWKKIEKRFYEIEREQFRSHGAAGGEPWPDLSEVTLRIKDYMMRTRQAVSLEPLIRTGRMWASLTQPGSVSGKILQMEKLWMRIGTSVPYARKHQFGIDVKKREVIRLTSTHLNEFTKIIQQTINANIRAAGTGTPAL